MNLTCIILTHNLVDPFAFFKYHRKAFCYLDMITHDMVGAAKLYRYQWVNLTI